MTETAGAAVMDGGAPPADDARAWAEVRGRLLAFVRRRVDDDATAEDLVHDVLVRAWTHRHAQDAPGRFASWLFQITRNAVVDHYRARRPAVPLPPDLAAEERDAGADARRELAACLRPSIDRLPPAYRDALVLSELEGRTQAEMAARLGLSLSGAKSRVQRGRRLLAERMLACCRMEFDARGALAGYVRRDAGAPCPPGASGEPPCPDSSRRFPCRAG